MSEVIRLEKVTKNYILGKVVIPALTNLDLSVKQNEYLALMGASGSGKST